MSISGKQTVAIAVFVTVSVTLVSIALISCERAAPFCIKNDTMLTLSICVIPYPETTLHLEWEPNGIVESGKELRVDGVIMHYPTYLVEAKDAQENTVYKRIFTREELKNMRWRVTITKSQ